MIVNATLYNQYYILKSSIDSVIEYVKHNISKIKSTIRNDNKYEFLETINQYLTDIFDILYKHEDVLENEIECLMQIKPYITYIIGKNCENHDFGFIECCLYLLKLFKMIITTKFNYLKNQNEFEIYNEDLNSFPNELSKFRKYFNEFIYVPDHQLDNAINDLDLKLRDD